MGSALEHAASEAKMTVEEMKKIKTGDRRNLHDDITLVWVDLAGQYKPLG